MQLMLAGFCAVGVAAALWLVWVAGLRDLIDRVVASAGIPRLVTAFAVVVAVAWLSSCAVSGQPRSKPAAPPAAEAGKHCAVGSRVDASTVTVAWRCEGITHLFWRVEKGDHIIQISHQVKHAEKYVEDRDSDATKIVHLNASYAGGTEHHAVKVPKR